jgi:hypothetical protein
MGIGWTVIVKHLKITELASANAIRAFVSCQSPRGNYGGSKVMRLGDVRIPHAKATPSRLIVRRLPFIFAVPSGLPARGREIF